MSRSVARPSSTCAAVFLALVPLQQGKTQRRDLPHDIRFELYRDPARFAQLSNAAQNLLIGLYGPHPRFDEKGNRIEGPTRPDFGHPPVREHELNPGGGADPENVLGNVLVNDPFQDATAQDTQSETALVMASPGRLVAAFNDSGSFIGANAFTGWAWSADGGATWTDPGTLPGGNDAGDPVLARHDASGRIYLAALFFNGTGINIFRSDDDGQSWLAPVNGTNGAAGFQDKEWLAVDNFPGAGNGNVYMITREFGGREGIFLYRSTDQGATFGPVGGVQIVAGFPSNVQGAYVVVAPNHDVHAFWYDSNFSPAQLRTRRSTDGGLTFGAPVTVTNLTSNITNGNLSLVAGFRSNSFPQCAVNPVSGHLYVVYNDPTAVSGGDRGNILLRVSSDQGATWSAPQQVNADATTRAQYFPTIAVRPNGGGLAVCWYDNRNDPADRRIERWGATASISGSSVTFGPNFRLSPAFDPVFGVDPVVNSVYMGDYDQLVADDTTYYSTWGDNRDDSIAVPGRKNANVRFTTFTQEGPGPLLDFGGVVVAGGNLNGRIDFDECNELFATLSNSGSVPVTGLFAELTTTTPGVTVIDGVQAYPDLAPGDSVANPIPFRVSTSPAFACGTPVEFVLTVTSSAGTGPFPFQLQTGGGDYIVTVGSDGLLGGTNDIGNRGDDVVTTIPLPFPVTLYDSSFSGVTLSSNGNAQFSGGSSAFSNECLPTATLSNTILAHWDDLRTDGSGSGIFTRVVGSAPNRTFVIEWRTIYFSGGGNANFELRLHEGSSAFEIVHARIDQAGASATVGVQQGSGTKSTLYTCNQPLTNGALLSFTLPECEGGGGECITTECLTLDFENEVGGAPIANGQAISDEYASWVAISGGGSNLGPVAFDSTPGGPNDPSINTDMLVGHGNLLLLQSNQFPAQSVPGIFDTITDDADGGDLVFAFVSPVDPQSLLLADINPEPNLGASVTLVDENGRTRVYTVQPGYTGEYGDAGPWPLDLTTSAVQIGNAPGHRLATAVEQPGFLQDRVVRLVVHMTGFGAMDELSVCR